MEILHIWGGRQREKGRISKGEKEDVKGKLERSYLCVSDREKERQVLNGF